MISYETKLGSVAFADGYLTKLIGNAVSTCYGVVDMAPGGRRQHIKQIFNKKEYTNKGIKIKGNADSLIVEIHIVVIYGMNINAIAKSIVNKVQFTVKSLTDINVEKVIVKVDDIKE